MFRKTRFQLALLNSIAFFGILLIFGASIFFVTRHRFVMEENTTLTTQASLIRNGDLDRMRNDDHHDDDHDNHHDKNQNETEEVKQTHVISILLDKQGHVLEQDPANSLSTQTIQLVRKNAQLNQLTTMDVGGTSFRVMSLAPPTGSAAMTGPQPSVVLLLYNRAEDVAFLRNLLRMIEIGTVIGAALSLLIGIYLAQRALIPIQNAWLRQQQFVADASHELRTPLAITQTQLDRLFRHPSRTIEEMSENLGNIQRETSRMRRLVADLLTLARTDSNQLQIQRQPTELHECLAATVESFRPFAETKDIHLDAALQAVTVQVDPERMTQLLTILLDNAMKFTDTGGRVDVSLEPVGHHVKLVVTDTGIGISPVDLPHVFNRFYQSDKARSGSGSGLGLAIAKWIVEAHQGKISIRSPVANGHGTAVEVTMPI
ncbi:sensor histidine kinase [Alicyclobacillus acidiphilus]|uniref:sensor histidine kinase n=1 Tax=Alicyclobacillus acidiphilus TaxID=182455 RepID=UPI00082B6B43|nr:HAMP domain-containing sensor histidine kinase [Alicyclobacillus acidiphilus]